MAENSANGQQQVFGSYRAVREIGRGGMGVVYEGEHVRLAGKRAAIKVISAERAGRGDFLARFEREASVLAKIEDSPHIAKVYDYGHQGDAAYLCMELIDGTPLDQLVRASGKLPPEQAFRIAGDVAGALDHIHQRGLVHRDIKPSNLILDKNGRVVIADFGLAIPASGGDRITQDGSVACTPAYASPEQCCGQQLDARSDVYSLGATLYEMLSGRPPFEGENHLQTMQKVLHGESPELEGLSDRESGILKRMMAKDPAKRYPSARHAKADIDRYLAGEPPLEELLAASTVVESAAGATPRPRAPRSLNGPLLAVIGGVIALAVALVLALAGPCQKKHEQLLGFSPEERLAGERGAKLDAYRQLGEYVYGIRIDSETTVRDFVLQSDKVKGEVDALIRGVHFSEPRFFEDGMVEIDATLTLAKLEVTLKEHALEVPGWSEQRFEGMVRKIGSKEITVTGRAAIPRNSQGTIVVE